MPAVAKRCGLKTGATLGHCHPLMLEEEVIAGVFLLRGSGTGVSLDQDHVQDLGPRSITGVEGKGGG